MELLRPPMSKESLTQLVRILREATTLNLNDQPNLHRTLMATAFEHFAEREGALLVLLLLRYTANYDMDSHIIDRCLKQISTTAKEESDLLALYVSILECLTDKAQDFEISRKVQQ